MDAKNLDVVLDVKVDLTARLGSSQLPMREIVDLTPGTVYSWIARLKDPIELLVNNKVVAYGEVVVWRISSVLRFPALWNLRSESPQDQPRAGGFPLGFLSAKSAG